MDHPPVQLVNGETEDKGKPSRDERMGCVIPVAASPPLPGDCRDKQWNADYRKPDQQKISGSAGPRNAVDGIRK